MSVNLETTATKFAALVATADKALVDQMGTLPSNPSQADLINLQKGFQTWSLLVSILTTSYKEVADTLKGIVQKI
jgi:hypothetical protein